MADLKIRTENANRTSTVISALNMLENTDFQKMMGSGILVSFTPITPNRSLGEEFILAAEDMTEIAPLFVQSIRKFLELRAVMLQGELGDIRKALE